MERLPATRMESFEHTTCSFIIKIWTDVEDSPYPKVWRGRVTHIPSGSHYTIADLPHLTQIIASYLEEMGVRADPDPAAREGDRMHHSENDA